MTRSDPAGAAGDGATRQVWDLPVRLFHWTIVLLVVAAYVTHRMGVTAFDWHRRCGYAVLVLVAFRIVWGLVGTRHARFGNFVRSPKRTLGYVGALLRGQHPLSVGHNPLGALMVLLLLAGLGAQAATGLFANDDIFNFGPLYGYVADATSKTLTSIHRQLYWWIVAAVALHVAAVVAHRLLAGENLVSAMITGRKPAASVPQDEAISGSRLLLALVLLAALAGLLAWIIQQAPQPAPDFY